MQQPTAEDWQQPVSMLAKVHDCTEPCSKVQNCLNMRPANGLARSTHRHRKVLHHVVDCGALGLKPNLQRQQGWVSQPYTLKTQKKQAVCSGHA